MNYLANVVFPFTFFTSDRKTRGFLHAFLSGFYIQLGHYSREQKVANRFKRPVQKNREQLNNEPTWRFATYLNLHLCLLPTSRMNYNGFSQQDRSRPNTKPRFTPLIKRY